MISQSGIDLAVHIIGSHFGDLVAKVCGCLLRRGSLSLDEIVRFSDLPKPAVEGSIPFDQRKSSDPRRETVKNCLLVLIQHNCVQAFSLRKSTKFVTLYMALFDNVVSRLRFSKFLAIVKQDLGPECQIILQGLLQNGRLSFDQLLGRALSSSNQPEGNSSIREDVRANFERLVYGHYVECCPKAEPIIESSPEEQALVPSARASKFQDPLEKRAMKEAAASDGERFSGFSDFAAEVSDVKPVSVGFSAGSKRKFEAIDVDHDSQKAIKEKEVLWRANFEKFIYCLKKKMCAAHVRSRLGLESGSLLEAIMESSDEQDSSDSTSVTAPIDKILECVRGKPGGIAMTMDQIRVVLDQLHCRLSTNDIGLFYTIDLRDIIETCQSDEVELHVSAKYGKDAYRIFRYLIKTGHHVETDRISDVTFVEKKVNQQILNRLWKDQYVDVKKGVVPQADRQKHFFMCTVDKTSLWKIFLNDMYHAAFNLSLKISQLVEHEIEVKQDTEKFKWVRRSRVVLEATLLKLDDTLMLFHEFSKTSDCT